MSIDPTAAITDIDDVLATQVGGGGSMAAAHSNMMMLACIERWAPPHSPFRKQAELAQRDPKLNQILKGIIAALRRDYEKGMVRTFHQLVHAAVFDDLLEQAAYLLTDGYTLPAAVIAGATLEEHLRKLANAHQLPLTKPGRNGAPVPKTAGEVNNDLYGAKVFPQPQWRLNQVWIDLRNEAAHGKPEFQAHQPDDIMKMIDGVRDVVTRYPA